MKRMLIVALLGSGLLCVPACSDGGEDSEQSEEQAEDQSAQEDGSTSQKAQPTAEQVPVPEDFAKEANEEITKDNYEQELDRLSKEIEGSE